MENVAKYHNYYILELECNKLAQMIFFCFINKSKNWCKKRWQNLGVVFFNRRQPFEYYQVFTNEEWIANLHFQ